ncbi:sigma-70 family RNA polymerase sigma factor [Salibacteraceae bacterium]|nr:sigma-70 family RNA polymerase sigma factor [Salibacteraceae bacterium]
MPKHQLPPDTWIDKFSDQMLGFAVTRVRDRDTAKDLVQESFFVALRSKDQYRGELSEKNWLYLILRSRILDHYKKKKEVLESQMKGSEGDEVNENFMENGAWNMDAAPKEWEADRMVESKEFMEVLDQCRDRLSELQQAIFTLKYIDGESSEDICKELDITSSNYWVLVHRAKLQLRNCLEIKWMT